VHKLFLLLFLTSILAISCNKEGDLTINQPPKTFFSLDEINLSGENRLNSIVSLSWYGTDPDGYVVGYELSYDKQNWFFTTSQDSIFRFSILGGSDTVDIELFVRAIDNNQLVDPNPARLVIPLRNTPPVISFSDKLTIPHEVNLVATTEWSATDLDGDETITQVYLSLDNKRWVQISRTNRTISIVPSDPKASDSTNALIYYGTSSQPAANQLEGLILNDSNRLFIKTIDQAGAESKIDSTTSFYLKGKTHDVLVIGGLAAADQSYQQILSAINLNHDFLNFAANNGEKQPKIWNITLKLQLSFYNKLFLYSDESLFDNSFSGVKGMILEFAAASLQDYANKGGKYFISTSFTHATNIEGFAGVLPIASLSTKNYGTARFFRDSVAFSNLPNFPDINPSGFVLIGVPVFNIDSADTEVLYEANLSERRPTEPWTDTKIVASGRRVNGQLNQVFFSVQLWELNGNQQNLEDLFDQILNVEFN
tara:strand:+ start:5646 stop:7091 length:1446 start_codon:yes stop_codon:yes gene_type:complete